MTERTSPRFLSCGRAAGLVLAVLLALGADAGLARAQKDDRDATRFKTNSPAVLAVFKPVVAQPSRSTVRIRCEGKEVALGTIVGADGWIVTKFSELKANPVCVLADGRQLPGRVTGVHEGYDLAMLKVEATNLKPVQWSDVKSAVVGNWVATPGTGDEPIAVGVVSVAARTTTPRDLPPVSDNSGYLGIALDHAEHGVKVAQVMPNSAAAKAGLKANDAILAIAGKVVRDPETLINTVQRFRPGQVVTMKVKRGDEELEIKATLDKRPANDRSDFQNRLGNELSSRRGGFPSVLQHDTVLRPSECGGPLVDLDGKVIGINIARAGRTETYAVPANEVKPLLEDLKADRLEKARAALEKADSERAAADKRVKKARAALDKGDKAKAELAKAESDHAAAEKRVKEARAALIEAEIEMDRLRKEK
jgi:serine protease Do